jgi:type IV secretory pathway VirJ component
MVDFMPQWKGAYYNLLAAYQTSQMTQVPVTLLSHIPYTITREKSATSNGQIALFFSGDGGWYGFEQTIADKLAAYGIPTIGIDVKRYLWNRRTPEETANDMADLLNYYGKEWNKTKFIVIGYSQGAELVPFVANRLPDILKSNIISTVMLSHGTTTDFEIHISNMLGLGSKQNKLNVVDEIVKMKDIPALCIFGENEKNPVPGLLKDSPVKIAFIPGDHHYRLNETLIVQTMKDKNAFEAPSR